MTTEAKIQITSSELGTLWMNYQATSASLMIFDLFKNNVIDKEAQNILSDYIIDAQNVKNEITNIFNNEKAVIPIAFD